MGQTAKQLREQYPVKGSMPQSAVERLYQLVDAEVLALSKKDVITVEDILQLERHGKVKVATDWMGKCDETAREALLQDEHPHVRSCALLAAKDLNAQESPTSGTLSLAAQELLANAEVRKWATRYVFMDRCELLRSNEGLREDVLLGIRERLSDVVDACDEVSDVGYRAKDGISICFNAVDLKDGIDDDFHQVEIDQVHLSELLLKEANNEINSEADIIALFEFEDAEADLSCGM